MELGYIARYRDKNGGYRFKFVECTYTVRISQGKRVYYSKCFHPLDIDEIEDNTEIMKHDGLILVTEPFFFDDDLRRKAVRWVEWANTADPKEYDIFEQIEKEKTE